MFISFEGIDFCGKSTQISLLKDFLEKEGKEVKVIREPGGTDISEKIREVLLDVENKNMKMETEILLFSASRSQLVREKIRPYLQQGFYVISDRFHDSSTAYQGYGRGIPVEIIENIHKLAVGETVPDLTFFIDVPVEVAAERRAEVKKEKLDRIENSEIDFYKAVRKGYQEIAKKEKRFKTIDGTLTKEKIHHQVIEMIEKFNLRRNYEISKDT